MHLLAFNYSFNLRTVLKLTRRQVVFYLENLTNQLKKDQSMQAKLHGFKVKAPVEKIKWSKTEDQKFKELAERRMSEMEATKE